MNRDRPFIFKLAPVQINICLYWKHKIVIQVFSISEPKVNIFFPIGKQTKPKKKKKKGKQRHKTSSNNTATTATIQGLHESASKINFSCKLLECVSQTWKTHSFHTKAYHNLT